MIERKEVKEEMEEEGEERMKEEVKEERKEKVKQEMEQEGNEMETEKARPPKKYSMLGGSVYMLKITGKTHPLLLALCVTQALLGVASSVLELFAAPVILEKVETAAPLSELLGAILLFALAMLLAGGLGSYAEENAAQSRYRVRRKMVEDAMNKFARTSFPNTEDVRFLDLMDKAGEVVGISRQAADAIWETFRDLLRDLLGFGIYLALLTALDWRLASLSAITAGVSYWFGRRMEAWGYRHREEEAGYTHQMSYVSRKSGDHRLGKDIRTFGMESWLRDVFDSTFRMYRNFQARAQRRAMWADVLDVCLTLLRNGAAYALLIHMALANGLGASRFLLYFTAIGGFTAWIGGILTDFARLHRQSMDISIVREYMDWEEPFLFEEGEALKPDPEGRYELTLNQVSFRYPGASEDTLKSIQLTIHPGEKLAVVGLNGAGKTTLIKLLCGFYDPTEGQVLLNGQDIRRYNRRDYYRLFSAVFQDFSLVASTVADNVAQGRESCDRERVRDCIAKAGLTKKIEGLPRGYDTHLEKSVYEDGVELSGGEIQRLMLARALYKDAPLLVLDEPTAALDPIAENDIYQKYSGFCEGKTSIFISHRLASTRFCDRILLLYGGRIAEEGTHEELLKRRGRYANLFEIQSRYYREGGEGDEPLWEC